MRRKQEHHYTVTGKACESGDIIIKDILLPTPVEGDLLAVLSTGAYHYSMSSNYNRLLKPAVVFVQNGQSRLIVKRETYDDLLRNDCK
jgi:diaminopimelate decarboxylase